MEDIKKRLFNLCIAYANERIDNASQAIADARISSTEDTKSSAGDKYETGRAMMQQDIDRQTLQLNEAQKLKTFLERMEPENKSERVQNGSLAYTNYGTFYIAISMGQVELDGETYYVISGVSPIGTQLMNQQKGARFAFNGREYEVQSVG